MSEAGRVTRAAGVVGAATFLSRIFGFVRDMVIAGFFGAGLGSDAFFVAFRIPNLLRRLFAEGSLSIAFIPVFTDYLHHQGREEAYRFAGSTFRLLSIILAGIILIGMIFSPQLVRIIAPGFADSPEKIVLTAHLTRIMFPYVFFICLVALCMGVLNTLDHFAAPALAPVFLNISMILSIFTLSPYMENPIEGLAVGVLIGGLLQFLLQIPFLMKKGFYLWKKAGIWHPGIERVGRLMLPTVFGSAVYQINILVGTLLASLLPEGSVSYLYYADRLVQFPLGIFAIATATAVLPSLSRQASAGEMTALGHTFAHAMNLISFITLPSLVGLIVLREPIITLLFQRGAFDMAAVRQTADALLYYSMGLWAFSAVRIVVSTFYALQDTKTPVKIAIVSIIANILLAMLLMIPLQHGGLALATSLASMINLMLLMRVLRKRLGTAGWGKIPESTLKSAIGSAVMGGAVWWIASLLIPHPGMSSWDLLIGLSVSIGAGMILYVLLAALMKSPELGVVAQLIKGRRGKAVLPEAADQSR